MPTIEQVREEIRAAARGDRHPVVAETFLQKWPSASRPVLCSCSDKSTRVIKGAHNGRQLVPDHVVGRLGQLIEAPVGITGFAVIPEELKGIEPQLSDVGPGIGHSTIWLPDCTDRQAVDHMNKEYNRERFARLQVLYSWAFAGDHQLIYAKTEPLLVYSVDHGHFFHGSTGWTPALLRQIGPVVLDQYFSACGLQVSALADATAALSRITDRDIELVAMGPPDEWGITIDDRTALTEYLVSRRDELLKLVP